MPLLWYMCASNSRPKYDTNVSIHQAKLLACYPPNNANNMAQAVCKEPHECLYESYTVADVVRDCLSTWRALRTHVWTQKHLD